MSDYSRYKPRKTEYKGVEFKSNLEAKCAECFDRLGIRWEYEPKTFRGQDFAGGQYTPDFYLPPADVYVEVVGVWDERHVQNFYAFTSQRDERYEEEYDCDIRRPSLLCINSKGYFCDPRNKESDRVLNRCKKCGSWIAKDMEGGWDCPTCGYYDGDGTLVYMSDWSDFFGMARFREAY